METTVEKLLDCGHFPSTHESFTTGYGTDDKGKTFCYDCCAKNDRQNMVNTGKATLYLVKRENPNHATVGMVNRSAHKWYVTNWPSSLEFQCTGITKGRHNMAGSRYDCWFCGPDGFVWHGYQIGENTQICHCKRTKQMWQKQSA